MNNLVRLVDLIDWNGTPEHKSAFGNSEVIYLYALVDPLLMTIRYIGITHKPLCRLQDHVYAALRGEHINPGLQGWICDLVNAGYYPRMTILRMLNPANWQMVERAYIQEHQDTVFNIAH